MPSVRFIDQLTARIFFAIVASVAVCSRSGPAAGALIGQIDAIVGSTASGWACDTDAPEKHVSVRFYADHAADKAPLGGAFIGEAVANQSSEASIGKACRGGNAHRFVHVLSKAFRSQLGPGVHPVYAYAKDEGTLAATPLKESPKALVVSGTKKILNTTAQF